jgi:hypothetical protein
VMTLLRIVIPLYLFVWAWSPRKRLAFVAREKGTHFSGSCSKGFPARLSPRPVRRRAVLDDSFAEMLLQYDLPAVSVGVECGNERRGMSVIRPAIFERRLTWFCRFDASVCAEPEAELSQRAKSPFQRHLKKIWKMLDLTEG